MRWWSPVPWLMPKAAARRREAKQESLFIRLDRLQLAQAVRRRIRRKPAQRDWKWPGPEPEPARWKAADGTIVYRSYEDYCDD